MYKFYVKFTYKPIGHLYYLCRICMVRIPALILVLVCLIECAYTFSSFPDIYSQRIILRQLFVVTILIMSLQPHDFGS